MAITRTALAVHERPLRILTVLTSALATPLLIATTIISLNGGAYSYYYHRRVTAFCFAYIPLALTVLASSLSLVHHRKHGKMPDGRFFSVDGLATLAYLGILIPVWAIEIGELGAPGFGLLAGYTTAPMIINMFVHGFMFCIAPSVLASFGAAQVHQCPNCHSSFTISESRVQETTQGGEGYSLLRGEEYLDVDDDAEHYADTNVRTSEEQIRPESESNEKGKKPMIEV